MKRRSFLKSASLAGAAGGLPLAFAAHAHASATPRVRVLRADDAIAGSAFRALDDSPCAECGVATVRVHLDGLHRTAESTLAQFGIEALFDQVRAPRAPFLAWSFAAGTPDRMSAPSSFVAQRATVRALDVTHRRADAQVCRERCELTRFDAPLLAPGHYVVVLDDAAASVDPLAAAASAAANLVHSGDRRAPLAGAAFDYFAFRVVAEG